MKKNLLLTYDYELFLGNRSGSVDECLLKPTYQTLDILKKYNAKAIFFVDTTYLLQLKTYFHIKECKDDFEKVIHQLQQIIKTGHYVFPHLHPHWLDAEYLRESNEWKLNKIEKYRFHLLTADERKQIFDGSIQLLKEIIHPITPEYKIDCYRAGGWCLQPFADFKPFFDKHQFKYDMSVMKGFYLFSEVQFFDYSNAPSKDIYTFQDDVLIENPNGHFKQFSISSIWINNPIRVADKIWLKYLYKIKRDHTFNRGQGQIAVASDMRKPASVNGQDILNSKKERISIELLSAIKLPAYFDYLKKHDYMHFISHPKMLTQHNHKTFDRFLKKAFSSFDVETDFKKNF